VAKKTEVDTGKEASYGKTRNGNQIETEEQVKEQIGKCNFFRFPHAFRFVLVQTAWQSQGDLPNLDSMSVQNSADWLVGSKVLALILPLHV
jgi:hypothetical protein